ncbi:MAG: OsmC family protein [Gemmatimonadota bacterium]
MSRSITAEVEQTGPSRSAGMVRDHRVVIDRPVSKGGADEGPMGGELMLLGLGGCFLSNLLAAIRTREAEISDVRVRVEGTLGGTPERFTRFGLHVSAAAGDEDLLAKLVTIAERGCLVANTLSTCVPLEVAVEQRRG